MAQHDFVISNQSFPATRADINAFLQAVGSTHSGTSLPSGAVAGLIWLDTTSATVPVLKYYDGTDNITLATINHTTNTVDFNDSSISTPLTVTGNATAGAELRLPEDTDNGSNYVALKAPDTLASNLTLTLPSADGTANQVLTTSGAGVLSFTNAPTGFRNIVINGNMAIDQRNAGASITAVNNTYCLDRWQTYSGSASKFSVQQVSDAPTGFSFSLKATSLSAYTVGASESFNINQFIEGFNTSNLVFGTASAKTVTLSFWVKSSLTGTFGGALNNASYGRSYPFTYTISSANTWEFKTVTVAGDTSGTWVGATNGIGLIVSFGIGNGSTVSGTANSWATATYTNATGATSVVGTNGATFFITGVQLEAGTTASDFEFLPVDVNLNRCYRYFEVENTNSNGIIAVAMVVSTSAILGYKQFKVVKRSSPSISFTGGPAIALKADTTSAGGTLTFQDISVDNCRADIGSASGLVAGNASVLYVSSTAIKISYNAEL